MALLLAWLLARRAGWRAGLSLALAALAMLLGYAVVMPGMLP